MGSRPRVGIGVPGHVLSPVQKEIGQTTNKKTSHLANAEIPQMADVSGGFLLYTECR
jgi:hypothetical protein